MRTMSNGFCTISVDAHAETATLMLRKTYNDNVIQFMCALTPGEIDRLCNLLQSEKKFIGSDLTRRS